MKFLRWFFPTNVRELIAVVLLSIVGLMLSGPTETQDCLGSPCDLVQGGSPAAPPPTIGQCRPCLTEAQVAPLANAEGNCAGTISTVSCTTTPGGLSFIVLSCSTPTPTTIATMLVNSPSVGDCSLDVNETYYSSITDVATTTYTDTEAECLQAIENVNALVGGTCT